jgi:N-acetylglucosaminyldiphosphoundecaprenol N-acetyl-beta-D-mannosaminyltransferase
MTLAESQRNTSNQPPDFYRDVYCILGLPFDAVRLGEAVGKVRMAAKSKTRLFLSTPNLNFLITAQTDAAFRNSVIHSDLSVADGMPIVWLAQLLGVPIRERVAGASVFQTLMSPARAATGHDEKTSTIRVFFFGGPTGVAQAAHERINTGAGLQNGGVTSVGYACPGFGTVDDMSTPAIIQQINASQADFLVVALGAAKGQAWIERNRAALTAPVLSHLGAVVNFVAGKVERAPAWVQRVGLEWLWRIKEEPALWRRYLADGKALIRLVLTRVAPLAWIHYTQRPRQIIAQSSGIDIEELGDWRLVSLRGAWVRANLEPLRALFNQAATERWRVKLDLQNVTYVDAAFLGLLMIFADHQENAAGAKLAVFESQFKVVNTVFKCAGLGYLLEKNGHSK